MIVVGARPSEGKSAFSLQMAYELSHKFKVLYISLEMTVEEAMFRLLCYKRGVDNVKFYKGGYEEYSQDVDRFEEELERTQPKLIVSEEIGKSWDEVDKIFQNFEYDKPDVVFLDYVSMIRKQGKSQEAIEEYIKNFRTLAIKMNFCLFILSQINRSNITDSKEPTMEGLKHSGALEENADKVLILYYPCKRSPDIDIHNFKIIVAKNKNGMTGYVDCKFEPSIYKFYEEQPKIEPQRELVNWND